MQEYSDVCKRLLGTNETQVQSKVKYSDDAFVLLPPERKSALLQQPCCLYRSSNRIAGILRLPTSGPAYLPFSWSAVLSDLTRLVLGAAIVASLEAGAHRVAATPLTSLVESRSIAKREPFSKQ